MRKSVGLAVCGVLAVIGLLMVYGIARRGKMNTEAAKEEHRNVEPATTSGNLLKTNVDAQATERRRMTSATAPVDVVPNGSSSGNGQPAPRSGASAPISEMPPLQVRGGAPQLTRRGTAAVAAPVATAAGGQAVQSRAETPEERMRARYAALQEQALSAPMTAQGGHGGGGALGGVTSAPGLGGGAGTGGAASAVGDILSRLGIGGNSSGAGSAGAASNTQGGQSEMEGFGEKAAVKSKQALVEATRVPRLAKFSILAGWKIPAVLEQGISSDLPGGVSALVRENVYDTATGRFLLVPQGSRLLGVYNSSVAYGQERVQIVWTRLIFPDGSSVLLGGMNGQDASGASGFHDQVDHHYKRLMGMALLTSGFAAGVQMSQQSGSSSPYGQPTASQAASQAVGQQMGQLGMEVTRKNMNVQPTIKIRVGYRFNVLVDKDLVFAEPYLARR